VIFSRQSARKQFRWLCPWARQQPAAGSLELYYLKENIGEKYNLAESLPEKTHQLLGVLRRRRKSVNAPVPSRLNPRYDPEKVIKSKD